MFKGCKFVDNIQVELYIAIETCVKFQYACTFIPHLKASLFQGKFVVSPDTASSLRTLCASQE